MPIRSASARPRAQRTGALQTAQELLAGAGYPEGFDVMFDYPAYRQPVCSTIGASLQEIGIQVEVALQPPEEVGQKDPDPHDRFLLLGLPRAGRFVLAAQRPVWQ
jgi:ABC-type transport system substrate-binding protein